MSEELKPCPFCGSSAQIESQFGREWWVQCTDLDCSFSDSVLSKLPAIASERWNRRVTPPAPSTAPLAFCTDGGPPMAHYTPPKLAQDWDEPALSTVREVSEHAWADDFDQWLKRRGPLGAGAIPERIFIAGWMAGQRRAALASHPATEQDAQALADVWDDATAQAALYVLTHCADGERHANAITSATRPVIRMAAHPATDDSTNAQAEQAQAAPPMQSLRDIVFDGPDDPHVMPPVAAPVSQQMFDFRAHLARQAAFSLRTFGPGMRTVGVTDHIRKELAEIAANPDDLMEWVDVVILALDGAWRCGGTPDQIINAIVAKQTKNEGRNWPDWRTADPNKAIEHDRTGEQSSTAGAAKGGGTKPESGEVDVEAELPTLPQTLLNLIAEYGMARADGLSDVERVHRWTLLIAGIKEYTREQVAARRQAGDAGE